MTRSEVFAPAKINLTLHVTGQRADGYHLLDSLVAFADVGDVLRFSPGSGLDLEVTGPFAAGVPTDARNLVWRAAELVGFKGHIHLEKNLPHGAGIGGGSSDAAAVLRYMGQSARAATLGADVPVCLQPRPQRMRGVGACLEPLPDLPSCGLVLVNPGVAVPTVSVFDALAHKENPPMPEQVPAFETLDALCIWLAGQRNDLEAAACAQFPEIEAALGALDQALVARMSGSGSTCFGLFADAAGVAEEIAAAHPDWWVVRTRLLAA